MKEIIQMAKTVTLRLNEDVYQKIKIAAEAERRSLANFMESTLLTHLEECTFVDEEEMAEILSNKSLLKRLEQGAKEIQQKKVKRQS